MKNIDISVQSITAVKPKPAHRLITDLMTENRMMIASARCPICGGIEFSNVKVLWPKLICDWQLAPSEVDYINRQQGTSCVSCGNNLRAMALATAVMDAFSYKGTLDDFCKNKLQLRVLEINRAGNLTGFFEKLPQHTLVEYPHFDMQALALPSGWFDLVIHSDTLDHVLNPVLGLSECRRVLTAGGSCIFTVPIIVDRMSRNRVGLPLSYHGAADVYSPDQIVHTEFGVDIWKTVISAGFRRCGIHAFDYPAAIALVAIK